MVCEILISSDHLPAPFSGFCIAQVSVLHNTEFGEDNATLLQMLFDWKGDDYIGKMLILSFEDNEHDIFNQILSVVNSKSFQVLNIEKFPLSFPGLEIDELRRVIVRNRREIELTYIEFEILKLLASNPGIVFTKEQIYDKVWKEPYFGDYNIVMSHIRNIREKIEDNPSKPVYIQTVWGVGYRFNQNISSGL